MPITTVTEPHCRFGAVARWALRLVSSWQHQAYVSRPGREMHLPRWRTYFGGTAALLVFPSSSSPSFNSTRQPYIE